MEMRNEQFHAITTKFHFNEKRKNWVDVGGNYLGSHPVEINHLFAIDILKGRTSSRKMKATSHP